MRWITLLICALYLANLQGQQTYTALRSHLSFEYGGQIPLADMAERFGSNFNLGSQFEVMQTRTKWLAGIKGYYLFGGTVKEDILANLRDPQGEVIGSDGGPAVIALHERGFFIGPYVGKLFALTDSKPHAGIKIQLGAGLLEHHIRIQDDNRNVPELSKEYRKGYDRLSNGLAGYLFLGYQHLDPGKRLNFLAGFDLTVAATQNRRDYDFVLMRKDTARRTDILAGVRIGWILPITTGIPPQTIYY